MSGKTLFIGYQTENRSFALEAQKALERLGFVVKIDTQIAASQSFIRWTDEAIRSSDGLVLLAGRGFGRYQGSELFGSSDFIVEGRLKLLWVLLPGANEDDIPVIYRHYRRIDLRREWNASELEQEVYAAFHGSAPQPVTFPKDGLIVDVSQTVDTLKLSVRGANFHFTVDSIALTEFINDVQFALGELSDAWRPDQPSSEATLGLVHRLARNGRDMRRVLFEHAAAEPLIAHMTQHKSIPITFDVGKLQCHVPWGLLFGTCGSDDPLNQLLDADLRAGFWWEAHQLAVIYRVQDGAAAIPRSASASARLIAALHEEARRYVDPNRAVDWPDACGKGYDWIIAQDATDDHVLLYFFCDSNAEKLCLHEDARDPANIMDPGKFAFRSKPRTAGLVFFNTPVEVNRGTVTWRKVTREKGLCGFVAPEVPIPTKFAWQFGNQFLHYVLHEHRSAAEAMRELRAEQWPFSLVYGAYCARDFTLAALNTNNFVPTPSGFDAEADPASADPRWATLPFKRGTITENRTSHGA